MDRVRHHLHPDQCLVSRQLQGGYTLKEGLFQWNDGTLHTVELCTPDRRGTERSGPAGTGEPGRSHAQEMMMGYAYHGAGGPEDENWAECGSYSGVRLHRVNGEEPCEACKAAARAYMNDWRRRTGRTGGTGPRPVPGPWPRLDAVRAAQIRARPGDSLRKLATEFGVSRTTVRDVRLGLTWKDA